ncbi:MAG: DUF1905 domain-containing protein [Sphingobacteriales bacterium]|nr:DUF1905 domain-containing protein [Sphingobacteriales bacterium]
MSYRFSAKIWQYKTAGGWYFVSVPERLSKEIRKCNKDLEQGWGRLKARVKTGSSEWDTAIWYDSKMVSYILPLNAPIRRKENLITGMRIVVEVRV